jgi:hypothetical protein
MRHPLSLVLRALRCSVFIIGTRIYVSAQTFPSTTSIDANTPSLVLPAALTLTSIVNQPTLAGGVATGSITFNADGNLLGAAPLTLMPATQSFPNAPTNSFNSSSIQPGSVPAGIVAADLLQSGKPALVVANNYSGIGSLYIYANLGAGQFEVPGTNLYGTPLTNGFGEQIDAIASGNFLSTTVKSVLVHEPGFYYVGSVPNPSSAALVFTPSSFAGTGSGADAEVIAIDDFNGDGYSDVGVLVLGENLEGFSNPPQVGIALNQGAANPGNLSDFLQATLPPNPSGNTSSAFCAEAITTGKFNSASNAQLAVLGYFFGTCSTTPPTGTASYVVFYTYTSATNTLNQTALVQVGSDQTSIAAADFNHDTNLDLVVGSQSNGQVQFYYGNGDGTFGSAVATTSTIGQPSNITVADFNGDGFPDLAVTLTGEGSPAILLNDGTGNLQAATQPLPSSQTAAVAEAVTAADLNGDGLADIAFLQPTGTTDILLSAESAQATLQVTTPMLAAGSHQLTASFPGDTNFQPSTSSVLTETVSKSIPAVAWSAPLPIFYPTILTSSQLNATSNVAGGTFTYTFPASAGCSPSTVTEPASPATFTTNCTPPPGSYVLNATYNPSDTFDYASSITPPVTLTVNLHSANATVSVPSSADPGDQPPIALTLSSFPLPVTVTITLGFTDSSSNPASSNGSICFLNTSASDTTNSSTCPTMDQFTIPANTNGAISPRLFSAGSVEGTVVVTIKLSTGTTDITPPTLTPQSVAIAPTVPQIQSVSMNTSGTDSLQVVVVGFSSTREISAATFHFTAVAGQTLTTPDVTISSIPEFAQWFTNPDSAQYGSAFTYTQNFTLNKDADVVSGVSVVLQNSQGSSTSQSSP